VWQGRFKGFLIQEDVHLIAVMRYVERNPLRAALVRRAEDWLWCSLRWRSTAQASLLAPCPVELPHDWSSYVNQPQTDAEIEAMRTCVYRQRPYGDRAWIATQARDRGLASSIAPIGRPKKR
jgi:putative transposase